MAQYSKIGNSLIKRQETVAVAESVTSGLIMAELSLLKNATEFFQGGLTAYNLGQKTKQLSIDPILAEKENCVSEMISEEMAINIAKLFCCPWGIAITGYAVPVPALDIKKCFAYYSIAYEGGIMFSGKIETSMKGQRRVQEYYVRIVLERLGDLLGENNLRID